MNGIGAVSNMATSALSRRPQRDDLEKPIHIKEHFCPLAPQENKLPRRRGTVRGCSGLNLSESLQCHGFLNQSMEFLHFDYVFKLLLMGDLGLGRAAFLL